MMTACCYSGVTTATYHDAPSSSHSTRTTTRRVVGVNSVTPRQQQQGAHHAAGGGGRVTIARLASSRRRRGLASSPPVRWAAVPVLRAARPGSFDPTDITIQGLTPLSEICDDFVCKSSPAVESSLRQIATDLVAIREDKRSLVPFTNDVAFDDGARKFVGREGFANHTYIADNIGEPKAAVEEMKMLELDRATIVWRLQGLAGGGKVDVRVVTELNLNLITGRATSVTETWDLSGCDAGAATFINTSRSAAALPKNLADAAGKLGKDVRDMISGDEDDSAGRDIQVDPNDPMKFFQDTNTAQDDYLQLALFLSAIYLIVRLLQATETLH